MLSRAMLEEGEERQDSAFEEVVVPVVDASLMGGEEEGGRGGGDQSTGSVEGPVEPCHVAILEPVEVRFSRWRKQKSSRSGVG